ncbi:MAG: helix-turn-helix transcriptional regulator [Oscillospiraceae bacterium]
MSPQYPQKYKLFGFKVAYYRKKANFTQEAFAEAIGKSTNFIAQIEAPSISCGASLGTIFKMADVLEIPVSKLFEFEDD